MDKMFGEVAFYVSSVMGSAWALLAVVSLILLTGWFFGFSAEWEAKLVSIVSITALLSIFFLQRSQSHNDRATHLKLDELVKALEGARSEVADIENESDEKIADLKQRM